MASEDGAAAAWFFDRPFAPGEDERLADAVAAWLCSEPLRWLIENVPGRRAPLARPEPLEVPAGLPALASAGSGKARLAAAAEILAGICDWSLPGTAWDFRQRGGERLFEEVDSAEDGAATATVGRRAEALGLRSPGSVAAKPATFVVLGGRRAAPLNRARAAAEAIGSLPAGSPTRVLFLCTDRPLDRAELESPAVGAYARSARTEVELMRAAARAVFGVEASSDPSSAASVGAEILLVVAPSFPGGRASTHDTLLFAAEELRSGGGSTALVTSPTCRPFQYLEAARALGLEAGVGFEVIAHPPAWAADPGERFARPHVYLQEVRSTIQAALRLAAELAADVAPPVAP